MDIQTKLVDQVTVVALSGRFTAAAAPQVIDALLKSVAADRAQVVVNLADVPFIDSSGLSVLVQGLKRCREHGGDLRLCGLQAPVRMIFELTRLHQAFEILPDEAAAVQAFQPA